MIIGFNFGWADYFIGGRKWERQNKQLKLQKLLMLETP